MIYTIKEVSKQVGVSIDTLRLWEKQELIPHPARTVTRHRQYNEDDLQTIKDFISSRYGDI